MYRIPKIQLTELKKVNKPMGPSEDASIPLGREKKAITGWGGAEEQRYMSGKGARQGKRVT